MKTLFISIIFCSFFGLNITAQKNTKLRAPEYNQIILFNNGTLPILKNNKWGLVDSNNVVKFPIEHDTITPSGTGLCIMKKGNISIIISQDFNVIYSGPSDSITYLNPGFKVGEEEFLLPTINSGVKKFSSHWALENAITSSNIISTLKKEQIDVDSLKFIQDGKDSLFVKICYADGTIIKSSKASRFRFIPPFFINDFYGHVINLKSKSKHDVNGIIKWAYNVGDSTYLFTSGINGRVFDSRLNSLFKTKIWNEIFIGNTFYSNDIYQPNSGKILQLPSGKILVDGISKMEKGDGYFIYKDSLNNSYFMDTSGSVFHSTSDEIFYHKALNRTGLIKGVGKQFILYTNNEKKYTLLSTFGKVLYSGSERPSLSYENIIRFSNRTGFYDESSDSFVYFNSKDIKYINDSTYAITVMQNGSTDPMWLVLNRKGEIRNQKYFKNIRVEPFKNSENLILKAETVDSIFYLDQSLNHISSLKSNNNYSMRGIPLLYPEYNTKQYKWRENELSFIRLNNNSIISSKFGLLKLDDFRYVFHCPAGEYFFIMDADGSQGYMRYNGHKLY